MSEIARRHALEIDVQQPINKPPVDFAGDLVDTIRAAVNDCGYSSMDILSGAGHDAMNIARVAPAAMIFVPCTDGLSHNEERRRRTWRPGALLFTLLRRAS
jgi:N-carbamoyl-L-amino-acid hydrolase